MNAFLTEPMIGGDIQELGRRLAASGNAPRPESETAPGYVGVAMLMTCCGEKLAASYQQGAALAAQGSDVFWPLSVPMMGGARAEAVKVYLKKMQRISLYEPSVPIIEPGDVIRLFEGERNEAFLIHVTPEIGPPTDLPKYFGSVSDHSLSTTDLANTLDRVSYPEEGKVIPVPFNPDEYPLF